jgi:hypothetical protein
MCAKEMQSPPRSAKPVGLLMPSMSRGKCGFVRRMGTGDIEIELYEFGARPEYEGPTVFIVGTQDVPALAERLAVGFGGPVPTVEALPEHLSEFLDVESLVDWLTATSGIRVTKRVVFNG